MKEKKGKKLQDITNLVVDSPEKDIWSKFVKYNKIKYAFLYGLGFLSGIAVISFIYLVV